MQWGGVGGPVPLSVAVGLWNDYASLPIHHQKTTSTHFFDNLLPLTTTEVFLYHLGLSDALLGLLFVYA